MILAGCSQGDTNTNLVAGLHENSSSTTGLLDNSGVFLINGENDFIEISNGMIILNPEFEQFIGGELLFKEGELAGVRNYYFEFYFYLNGEKTIINSSSASIEGSDIGMSIASNMGSSSSETMFIPEVWDAVFESLNFRLRGIFVTGELFEYEITLNVTKIANELLSDYRPMIYLQDILYGETAEYIEIE